VMPLGPKAAMVGRMEILRVMAPSISPKCFLTHNAA